MLTNWKTTIPGILAIAVVAFNAWQTRTLSWPDLQQALIGLGLVAAKDFNVSGGAKEQ